MKIFKHYKLEPSFSIIKDSAAASGWAGWTLAHPEFGSSVNPITTRGANYAHHSTASPPGFGIPAAALLSNFALEHCEEYIGP